MVVETPISPGLAGEDLLTVSVGGCLPPEAVSRRGKAPDVAVNGPLGAQFLVWEYATCDRRHLLGINPFDQPNVAESKTNTSRILADGHPRSPRPSGGPVQVYADPATLPEPPPWRGRCERW